MARKLRRNEIDLTQARVYHVVSRCVRAIDLLRAEDESRKELCMQYLQLLAENTAVEVAGFSLMDTHLHLLLRVNVERRGTSGVRPSKANSGCGPPAFPLNSVQWPVRSGIITRVLFTT